LKSGGGIRGQRPATKKEQYQLMEGRKPLSSRLPHGIVGEKGQDTGGMAHSRRSGKRTFTRETKGKVK